MAIDEELPKRVRQMTRATPGMLTVSVNPKESVIVSLLPLGTSLITIRYIQNVIIPVASQRT
jgi:hypothetical protein